MKKYCIRQNNIFIMKFTFYILMTNNVQKVVYSRNLVIKQKASYAFRPIKALICRVSWYTLKEEQLNPIICRRSVYNTSTRFIPSDRKHILYNNSVFIYVWITYLTLRFIATCIAIFSFQTLFGLLNAFFIRADLDVYKEKS